MDDSSGHVAGTGLPSNQQDSYLLAGNRDDDGDSQNIVSLDEAGGSLRPRVANILRGSEREERSKIKWRIG